jgi:2-phospho-L-lactate guanylyltransferase
MTRTLAVIPVRGSSSAKTRLAPLFTEDERLALVWSMLRRLVREIDASGVVAHTLVVTRDPAAVDAHLPMSDRVTILHQQDNDGLNASLGLGWDWATEHGYDVVLMLPGDLPLVTAEDICALVATPGALVIASDRAEDGTNAMCIDLGCWGDHPFRFRMGPGSCRHHIAEAASAGCPATPLFRPGIAHDLDSPRDWSDLPSDRQRVLLQDIHDSLSAAGYLA